MVVTCMLVPNFAFAEDVAGAEVLFEDARKLMAEGRHAEACPKFAESQRLAPAAGTLLNLGNCYEKLEKTASAWAAFREAVALSHSTGQSEREQYAKKRAAALESRLARVLITVEKPSDIGGLEIHRDGVLVARPQWGVAIPVDPGRHVVTATAPGKEPFDTVVDATRDGAVATVPIPVLRDTPSAPADVPTPPPTTERDDGEALRIAGITTAGAGVILIGAGTYFGLAAQSRESDLSDHATSRGAWTPEQASTYADGETAATLANVFLVSGAIALVAGGVLGYLGFSARPSRRGAAFACTF